MAWTVVIYLVHKSATWAALSTEITSHYTTWQDGCGFLTELCSVPETGTAYFFLSSILRMNNSPWGHKESDTTERLSQQGAHLFQLLAMHSRCMCECKVASVGSQSFETLWTKAHWAPLSMGSSSQEYWRGLPCPPPGDLPNPGIEPTCLTSPASAGGFFTTSTPWEAHIPGTPI